MGLEKEREIGWNSTNLKCCNFDVIEIYSTLGKYTMD